MIVVGTSSASLLQAQEISVVGFDTDYLEALGASDLADIAQFTPNLEIRSPFAASNPTLFIRGVGLRDFNANSSSSVAVYNDDIYMNSPAGQLAQLFDVSNVDVLRGPQGGIYGRNASAGAIRVISRKPSGTPGGYVNTTYGRFNQVDLEGATEAVLVPDALSIRIAGKMSRRDGTTKNRCGDPLFNSPVPGATPANSYIQRVHVSCFNTLSTAPTRRGGNGWVVGETPPIKDRVNDVNNWAARALVRWDAPLLDGMNWIFNFHIGQNRGDARQFQMLGAEQSATDIEPVIDRQIGIRDQNGYADSDNLFGGRNSEGLVLDPFGGKPFEGEYNNVEKERLDLYGANMVGELQYQDWTFKGIFGWEYNERDVELNLDGNPYPGLEPRLNNDAYQVTGELRAAWDGGNGVTAQIAGMFLYEGLNVDNEFQLSITDVRLQSYTMWTRYGALYGEVDWEPNEVITIHGGARLNYEEKELNLSSASVNQRILNNPNSTRDPINSSGGERSQADEIGFAGDLTISYKPTSEVTFYAKYARGWKGPHINGLVLSSNSAVQNSGDSLTTPVDPETVDSFEIGLKSFWWDSRLRLNGAFFYYDYNDIQVFRLRNTSGGIPVNQLINAEDADIKGVELDFDLRPFDGIGPEILSGFNVYASFAWLDSSYTDFVNQIQSNTSGVPPAVVTTTLDFSGAQLVNSPKYSFVGFARWILPTDYGTVVPRFDWSFKDKIFFSPENSKLIGQDALWLMNLRLTYKSPGERIEISGWVENLTDQTYTVDVFNLARFRRSILYAIGDPRTYGATLRVTF